MGAIHRDLIGWTELCADVNWQDYGGKWARKGPEGSWYVVAFENLYDRWGEKECLDANAVQFLCEVRYCDLPEVDGESVVGALQYVGLDEYIVRFDVDNSWRYQGRKASAELPELHLLDAVISYGISGVLTSFSSNTAAVGTRRKALQYVKEIMRYTNTLDSALDQTANACGNTVRDFSRGQIG
jgi:hypothetical protein